MSKFLTGTLVFLVSALALAADVQDAPIPDAPNWIGIILFLVVMVGGCAWFVMKVFFGGSTDAKGGKPGTK